MVFDIAGLSPQDERSQLMLRLIRVLHTVPGGHKSVEPIQRELSAVLADLRSLIDAAARLPEGQLALSLANDKSRHDEVKAALRAAGLRLADESHEHAAELSDDDDDGARRERLSRAGIDASAVMRQLNAGDTVRFAASVIEVPLPLAPEVWRETVFEQPIGPTELFAAIIADRNASLLYYGLCSLTPATREFLQGSPELLRWIYRERAGIFAAYGASLRVARGRVDVPGGDGARPLWEALVGERASNPAAFVRAVLEREDGRLAYLYETIDVLDDARQRFALGLAIEDPHVRIDRLRALYRTFIGIEAEWAPASLPFARPAYDTAMLLQIARVSNDGTLAAPAQVRLWEMAFESSDVPEEPLPLALPSDADLLDAAALAQVVALAPARHRRDRFETFAYGQRVFADAPAEHHGDVVVALRAFARFPAVMLILDRAGVTSAPTFAAAARHAVAIERIDDPNRHIPLQAQFQGAVAVLDRLARTGGLARESIEPLIASLVAAPPEGDPGYGGRIAAWIQSDLLPAVVAADRPAAGGAESRLISAFADITPDAGRRFEWEGWLYDVSIAESETQRIEAIRAKQGGNSLDAVLAFARDIAALADSAFPVERVKPAAAALKAHAAALASGKPWPGMSHDEVPHVQKAVDRAVRDLAKIKTPRQTANLQRVARPLQAVADYLLGEVLVALAYAPVLGDPANLLGGEADVAHRHDFGAGTAVSAEARKRSPWLRPRQATGQPIVGAVLGLDLVLASNALRRLASDRVPELPRLKQNDREVFTTSVVLMNPRHLTDAGMKRIAAAVADGRRRVNEAVSDPARLDELAHASRMSASRRHLLQWAMQHEPASVARLFSAMELLAIGDPAGRGSSGREPFGVAEEALTGCYCARFPAPGPWETFSGRPGTGQLATRIPDLTLRLMELLDELKVPATLLPAVLSLATQDFIDGVPALYSDDWPAAVAYVQNVTRERVEDYIASLTAIGPLRPVSSNQQ